MNEELKTGAVNPQGEIISASGAVIGKANPLDVPLTSESLAPETSYSVPETTQPTGAEGLSGFATSYAETFKKQQEALAQEARDASVAKEESKTGFMDSVSQFLGISASRAGEEEKAGLGEKAQKVTDVTNQIEASTRAQTNELRALDGQGLTDVQKSARSREINRRYAFEQADLALIQSAANRDYETASNIIDRKIELQLEPLRLKMEYQKLFYEENKEIFNKAEEREFNSLIKASEREYEEEKATRTGIANLITTALQNGVQLPARVIKELDSARNIQEATAILARNGVSLENPRDAENRRLQNEKLRLEIATLKAGGDNKPLVLQASTLEDVKGGLFEFTKSDKIPAAVREQIRKGIVMINKLNELIKENPDAEFAGGRFRATVAPLIPGAIEPRFQKLKADESKIRQDLVTYITGAAYTSLQADDVNKIIPRSQLFDAQNEQRVTNMANTIIGDLESALISSGINAQLPRFEDLFLAQMLSQLSPEQEAQLRAEGLIQ